MTYKFDDSDLARVSNAIKALELGQGVVLLNDTLPNKQGCLCYAASNINKESITRLMGDGNGLLRLCITEQKAQALSLATMYEPGADPTQAAFTLSVESTGVGELRHSDKGKLMTIKTVIDPCASYESIISPGDVFPVVAKDGGVLRHLSLIEGCIDLVSIAGLNHSAVMSVLKNSNGKVKNEIELYSYALSHHYPLLCLTDIRHYRLGGMSDAKFNYEPLQEQI